MPDIKISSTNGNSRQRSAVRAYVGGVLVAEMYINTRNPIKYLRGLRASKYHVSLRDQLLAAMQSGVITLAQEKIILEKVFPLIHGVQA